MTNLNLFAPNLASQQAVKIQIFAIFDNVSNIFLFILVPK